MPSRPIVSLSGPCGTAADLYAALQRARGSIDYADRPPATGTRHAPACRRYPTQQNLRCDARRWPYEHLAVYLAHCTGTGPSSRLRPSSQVLVRRPDDLAAPSAGERIHRARTNSEAEPLLDTASGGSAIGRRAFMPAALRWRAAFCDCGAALETPSDVKPCRAAPIHLPWPTVDSAAADHSKLRVRDHRNAESRRRSVV